MKTLITGANGFIGKHLAQNLLARGHEVRGMVRREAARKDLEALGVEVVRGDVTQPETLPSCLADVDVVFHLAGLVKSLGYDELLKVNEGGVDKVARACAQQQTPPVLVLASSLAASGPAPGDAPRTEVDPPCPVSNYGRSKRAGELAAERWAGDAPITIVRPPIVFGEGDLNTCQIFRPIAHHGLHAVPGMQTRKFSVIHADDLSLAMILAAERGARLRAAEGRDPGEAQGYYFVADDENPSYDELGQLIGRAVGRDHVRIIHTPDWLSRCAGAIGELLAHIRRRPGIFNLDKVREATAGSWICSADRMRREIGFHVAASLRERLKQTADWYFKKGWI